MNAPKHIAIIMDGNGRWATKKGLPRSYGHKAGEKAVKNIIEACYNIEIPVLSLFAFSTENWNRDKQEVDNLFELLTNFLKKFLSEAIKREIRITIMGDMEKLPQNLRIELNKVIDQTKGFKKLTVNIGLNYGGRAEIVQACNKAVENNEQITEESIRKYLYTTNLIDPDLVIRTSGEQRFSNFMIYQCAYSELYFTDVLWPDFDEKELKKAIEDFSSRTRRFGKAK